jgi:type II secretory pathway component PulM
MQLTVPHPSADRAPGQARGEKLCGRDQPVLAGRDPRDDGTCVTYVALSGSGVTHVAIVRPFSERNNTRSAT